MFVVGSGAQKGAHARSNAGDLIASFVYIYCTQSMSAELNLSHAAESLPIIVFQSRALHIPSVVDNDCGCSRDPQFSTPRKRCLTTEFTRTPAHISKRSRLCAASGGALSSSFEFCVQPVNMSFVLSGSIHPYSTRLRNACK